ncbi:Type I secretion outer membrane protein, TolC precursor [Candidatus Rhodobacter oscarellae]|uniref:Type I secretion outer membrane protein, TolC n=1 Tax=Candidatus Rhodobacter oscarellae TaxID=1675527 RepID=A0A0J9E6Y5_9RHOB|nr:TolC family outer membrane protein [Candidatus Rhodobacter lobularis]KMW58441.1 Type I secretion outer membrane protein, TolC precursor [Candidatus Rhodobacter lobularis]
MKTGWIKGVAFAVVASAIWAPIEARAESLTDAFISAFRASNLLDQQRALLRAADEDVAQAAASLLPVITFVGRSSFNAPSLSPVATSNWTSTASLNATLTLYDNGRTRYAVDAAKETVLGVRSALVQAEQQVLLNAVQAYMEMIRAAQFVSLSQSNVRLITQELRAARDRFEVGEVTRTDVSIAEARLASSRGNLAAAQGDLEVARENYNAVVGRYPGNLRWPTNPPMKSRTLAAAKAFAARNHPSIDEAQRNVNAAELSIKRAGAAMGPTLGATAGHTVAEGLSSSSSVTLELSQTLYAGGARRSAKRQAVANRDAARAGLLQTVVTVKQNVGTAWANLSVSAARTEAARREVRAARVAFDGVREEAKFGSRTTLDVLNAEQDLLDARSNLISAEVQQYVSLYTLFSAMGVLTVEHLGLGIPTYDPVEYYNYATRHDPARVISRQGRALDRVLDALKR